MTFRVRPPPQEARERGENLVPGPMAVGVVHDLEVVDVAEDRGVVPPAAAEFLQTHEKAATIGQCGEFVRLGQRAQLLGEKRALLLEHHALAVPRLQVSSAL